MTSPAGGRSRSPGDRGRRVGGRPSRRSERERVADPAPGDGRRGLSFHPPPPARGARGGGPWIDVSLLVLGKLAVGLYVLYAGFSHVSDDDYARTVISEQFAHSPRLDPSGTSWLPLPFWVAGAAMAVAGRSLIVSRVVATALGAISVAVPYGAMRAIGVERAAAIAATAAAMMLPWNAWLGVAMVPEGWTGALIGGALIGMIDARTRPAAAAGLFAASLSRYEAWPACASFAALGVARTCAAREHGVKAREALWTLLALAGPLAWMGWNAHAHGSAFHFLARVRAFRRSTGAGGISLTDKLLGYPRALADQTPEVALLASFGLVGLLCDARLRRRWAWSAAAAAAIVLCLVVGDVQDGAPTHHPARALSPIWWIVAGLAADAAALALRSARPPIRAAAAAGLAAGALAWGASLPARWRASPGRTAWERRDPQVAAGLALRARGVTSVQITPCAYEHFALLAAWGQPERAHVNASLHRPPTADCPRVTEH